MQTQRTIDGARTQESTLITSPVVPQRLARRATARRASTRRATARQRNDDVEAFIIEYLKHRPQSTTGDMAKALNARRGTIAAGVSHMVRAQLDHEAPHGQIAMAHPLNAGVRSEEGAAGHDVGPTITAALDDGPLRGQRVEAQVVEGRPPSTVDVLADDASTYRYCLADWVQSGPSAVYTFLYRV